ncbi:MAG: ABC transporter ATP-binding protein, partial [Candidatus Neomarinimicrobiota bacterium]
MSAIQAAPIVAVIYLIRLAFDQAINQNNFSLLIKYGLIIFLLSLFTAAVTLLSRYITIKSSQTAIRRFRTDLLTLCFSYSRSFYSQTDISKLHSSIVQNTHRLDSLSFAVISLMLPSFITSLGILVILGIYNWILFLILLGFIPLIIVLSRPTGRQIRSNAQRHIRSFDTFSKGVLFMLQMMDLTRIQAAEEYEIERQGKNLEEIERTSGRNIWLRTIYSTVQNTLGLMAGIVIMVVGGAFVINGSLSVGELISFFFGVSVLRRYQSSASSALPVVIAGNQALNTLMEITEIKDHRPYSGQKKISFHGKVSFENVSFQYTDDLILKDISFEMSPSDSIALVGPNGSGKSTVLNLLLGFYRPQAGLVKIDDRKLDELDIIHLRKQIGVVTQNPIQFSGTIRENITYGYSKIDRELLKQAVELALVSEFTKDFSHGLDTFIGEGGTLLSGGQRQKIAIARAI